MRVTPPHLQNAAGERRLDFVPARAFQSIAFSSPKLTTGGTHGLHLGGSATGTAADGLYTSGAYTAGTLAKSFATPGIVTRVPF